VARRARGLRHRFDEETIPRLAVLTALAYGLGLVMLPLCPAAPAATPSAWRRWR
jgi:hypothetical protein